MTREECILLGTIAKTYGVRGELIIRTANPSFDLKQDWESLFLQIDGILVPFFISGLRKFKPGEWIVKFDWYEEKSKAEKLVGYQVFVQEEWMDVEEDEFYMDELAGFRFQDTTSSKSGQVTGFMDIPDNPLFEVEVEGASKMVPAREEFILEIDTVNRTITFQLPEDLI
jgi:16S rRNA processing protein RimM